MNKCSFCGKLQKSYLSKGYCVSCYQYFIIYKYSIWLKSPYGAISYVADINSNQYGMPICHICGKAFTKLQQHIYQAHNLTKRQYCDLFGLDHNICMTEKSYNKKMREYALKNNMDQQLKVAGMNTRFKPGHNLKYDRSYQTKQRLCLQGILIGNKFGGTAKKFNNETNS